MTPSPGHLAASLPSPPLDFAAACRAAAELGFTHADVVALADRPAAHLEALADTGLLVQCAALGCDLPQGLALDATDVSARRAALDVVKRQVADAARLGAISTYIVPVSDPGARALAEFAEVCVTLADYAAQRMMRLCIEHVPGPALPGAAATLDWIESVAHPNLFLLLDVGHRLLSGEDAAATVRRAGPRLGYVRLDGNRGRGHLHRPLLTALRALDYCGGVALVPSATHADPLRALADGRALVARLLAG
jgi:sugar phosphate isomerase/epimerase